MSVDLISQLRSLWHKSAAAKSSQEPLKGVQSASEVAPRHIPKLDLQEHLRVAWQTTSFNATPITSQRSTPVEFKQISPSPTVTTAQPVFVDLETQSACDLTVAGGQKYASHHLLDWSRWLRLLTRRW